jgi:Nif-specific regulatory protein
VLPITIPPLRERREDIEELAGFFLKSYKGEKNKQFNGFSSDALAAMQSYSWPGNIRELKNCVERACVIGKNKWINREDLFPKPVGKSYIPEKAGKDRNLKEAVNIFKAGFIRKVLEENDWNKSDASRALAIQRTYLSRLIKELNINDHKEQI